VLGVPTPDPLGVPTPDPGLGAPTPVPGLGVPIPEPGLGVPIPPLFVAGAQGSTRVPLVIVVGFVVVTDPVVPVGATLPALPEVPTVGVVGRAPGAAGADVPVVGATPVGVAPGVVLDVVLSGVVAGTLAVVPVVGVPEALESRRFPQRFRMRCHFLQSASPLGCRSHQRHRVLSDRTASAA